jgi:hypothetical protein
MNLDWGLAIAIFTMFVIWSIVYYMGFFSERTDLSQSVDSSSMRVIEFIETKETSIPVPYDSPSPGQAVLFADIPIPDDSLEGLSVSDGFEDLPCMLQGGSLYWYADLSQGDNVFTISYSDSDNAGCHDTLQTAGSNQTYPLAAVTAAKVSSSRLAALSGVPYENFRSSLDIQENVRIEWSGPVQGSYGPGIPINTDVSSYETSRPWLDGPGEVVIRLLFWE